MLEFPADVPRKEIPLRNNGHNYTSASPDNISALELGNPMPFPPSTDELSAEIRALRQRMRQ
jgi:hypothetical protein